jgi:alpha-ketoglutarate-dependent taurine dioxygenase
VEIVELPEPLGAEVRGVDLRAPLSGVEIAPLRDAFDRRHLLLFR